MFCGECGTKNAKGAKFCESCGATLVEEKSVPNTKTDKKTTNNDNLATKVSKMSKQNKIIMGIVIAIVVIFIAFYAIMSSKLSPKAIAEDYFLAVANVDANKLYKYLDIDESEFTTKDMFVKVMEESTDDDDKMKVANYTVGNAKKELTGLSTTVTITYVLDGKKDSETADITLVKQKSKKYLIFDDWRVSTDGLTTVKDFEIKVLKGSELSIEGVKVDKKYLDKKESTETYDVYHMPAMFTTTYKATIKLPMGFEVEDNIRVSEYSKYTYSFDKNTLPDKVKTQIANNIKKGLQTLYDGAKDKKEFSDIKKSFTFKGADLSDLEDAYNSLARSISNSGLTSISFTDIELSSLSTNSDGSLYASVKAKYKYTVSYESSGETKTHDSNDYDYMYIYLTYADKEFRIIDASSLNTYFSKYY